MNDLIDQIIGHLGAARVQRSARDDSIIASHIDQALTAAKELRSLIAIANSTMLPSKTFQRPPLDCVGVDISAGKGKATVRE